MSSASVTLSQACSPEQLGDADAYQLRVFDTQSFFVTNLPSISMRKEKRKDLLLLLSQESTVDECAR